MPVWIAQALRIIALSFGGGVAFEGGQRALGGGEFVSGTEGEGIPGFGRRIYDSVTGKLIGGRRRRRRRALTASDRADIAFIAGMISKVAAKDFAVQLAARPR